MAGGLPRRGGCAGVVSGGKNAAFSRCTETESTFVPILSLKKWRRLSTTL